MKLKVRIFNDRFAFEETLQFPIEDIYDLQIRQYWEQAEPILCKVEDVPQTHPVYGWLEGYAQSKNTLDIDFTHVEFTKVDVNGAGMIFAPYIPVLENPEVDGEIMQRYADKEINPNFYGKITIEGRASGDAADFENLSDG